jgi:hypothetical protein
MNLKQNGKSFTGTAHYEFYPGKHLFEGPDSQFGEVDGTIDGDRFHAKIFWRYGETGVYDGKVSPQGRIEGKAYIKQDPNNAARKCTWYSNERMECAGGAAAAPTPKPIHKTARGPVASTSAAPEKEKAAGQPTISANPTSVNIPAGRDHGNTTITWDGGPEHPYAEVWVKTEGEDEKRILESGKGSQPMRVEPGRNIFILTDSGNTLATVEVEGRQ